MSTNEIAACGYIPKHLETFEWNRKIKNDLIYWRNDCNFELPLIDDDKIWNASSADDCQEKCIQNVTCNYFSYEGTIGNCYLMFEFELKQPSKSKDKDEKWACGYFPKRVWYKSVEDERLLVKFNNCDAAFMSSLMVNLSSDVIMTNKTSFRLCSSACLEDHRCSAVSYNGEDGNCVFALNAFKFHRDGRAVMDFWNWNLLQFQRDGFKLSSTAATATFIGSRKCGIITSRVWNPEANYSWRNGCKFEADYFETIDIKNSNSSISPIKQCSELCFNNLGCAHFNVEKKVCVLIWEWVESVLLEETNEKK